MDTQTPQPNMTPPNQAPHQNFMLDLENIFDKYLNKQAPFHLPPEVKEFIVKYGPWVNLVLLILTLPMILAAFGLGLLVLPFAAIIHPFGSIGGIISWLIVLLTFGLQIAALPGLFKRAMSSWRLLYYAALVSALGTLIRLDIVSLILGLLISMYILFQVKEKYH